MRRQSQSARIYDHWMAGDADKEHTDGGNMRAPAHRILGAWVLKALNKLDMERVKKLLQGVCVCVCVCVCVW